MQDDLLRFYNQELTYLRRLGAEFAAHYPKVASRLQLEPTKCEDPHVERLLEGFAFLAARVQLRLDEDLPEVSETLLDVLHPQHVRPVPSMAIAELELDPMLGQLPQGLRVARGSELRSRPVQGMPCRFRTCYDTTLWPATIAAAEWTTADRVGRGARVGDAVGAVRVELRAFEGMRLGELTVAPPETEGGPAVEGLGPLRLHLASDPSVADALYELLLNNCTSVVVRDPDQPTRAPVVLGGSGDAVRPVGFDEHETMLPYPRRALRAYTLLQELFVFPQKFQFVDVVGVAAALQSLGAGPRAELFFVVSPFERAERRELLSLGLSARALRLGCTPVVNLFSQSGEPILLTERQPEYLVVPDARRRLEIETWSVDSIVGIRPGEKEPVPIEPMYAFRSGRSTSAGRVVWQSVRRPSGWRTDRGTDVFLSFADLSGALRAPDAQVASPRLTCFNGDLPSRLPFGVDERGDFELTQGGPVRRVLCLVKPTPVRQPALGKPLLWRLVSTLSLNHLSLVDNENGSGLEALRELLRLHNVGDSEAARQQILGLVGVRSEPAFARVVSDQGLAFARGRRVELHFDEEQFPGGGMFLFASVLERFLALQATMNSFTQVVVRSRQRKRVVRQWAPRAGVRALV
ncbi:type VI secretion protein, VC_A0110 family (plasmid) [Gemmatirosa kalamazoonensis]|uniref:Type VI secretion protein, VC_A0110 family n=1 Tax=Gemmatirosa kalamazoonensis TaxID=861299 RepID=W0RTS8_9BACT|nr:type VI secretion system baseplate subunit TssF [Gemmatirosa kalamazoonensis]AHG92998.1 type VI secretion protein, VC_A0110 family [Gemmatirosa kalamazoonensis]